MPTLFTKIIRGDIPGDIVYQDRYCVAIKDIAPQAPVHLLIIPRTEISGVSAVEKTGDHQYLLNAARNIAEEMGIEGYRLVINQGEAAGQTVPHLHMHLLAGRDLSWPPG